MQLSINLGGNTFLHKLCLRLCKSELNKFHVLFNLNVRSINVVIRPVLYLSE